MAEGEDKEAKRISIDLPIDLIDGVDRLRKEWGLRRRGQVFERLLQVILPKDSDEELIENSQIEFIHNNHHDSISDQREIDNSKKEEKALVIVGNKNIEIVKSFSGLIVDFARSNDANILIKGVRGPVDYDYELQMAGMNSTMNPDIETIFLISRPEFSYIFVILSRFGRNTFQIGRAHV